MPILMTALAAGLALVPLAMSMGEAGSEIQGPMALVILCDLASSTALKHDVVPVLYAHFGRPVAAEITQHTDEAGIYSESLRNQ